MTRACARRAMNRCDAGGMALSSAPTTTQLGMVCHAAAVAGSLSALSVIGRCSAA